MPVIGHCGNDAVDLLVGEQLLVAARRPQVGAGDFTRADVPPVVEVAGGGALDAGQGDGPCEQAGPLHPDADHPEAHAVAGGHLLRGSAERLRLERDSIHGEACADGGGARLKELTTGRTDLHGPSCMG